MYIFDNVCLSKFKQSKDCFRKKIVKFYKQYLPDLADLRALLRETDIRSMPEKKNYLTRVANSKLFYGNIIQLRVDELVEKTSPASSSEGIV